MSAIGDIIWIRPLLKSLELSLPQTQITCFVGRGMSPLLHDFKKIEIVEVEKPRKISGYKKIVGEINQKTYDVFLCTQANLRVNLIFPFIKAKRKIGWDQKRGRDLHKLFVSESIPFKEQHSLQAFLEFARKLELSSIVDRAPMSVDSKSQKWANENLPKNYIVYHAKASSLDRTLGVDTAKKFIEWVIDEKNISVVLTGGPDDISFTQKLERDQVFNIAGKSSLSELAAALKGAKLVVAPDSGPIHMAAALEVPTMGLYAAVPASYTGPYSQVDNCIDVYPKAVKKYLGKSVEQVSWRTRVHHPDLMSLITFEKLKEKFCELIK